MEFNIIILPIPIEVLYKYIFDYFNKNIAMIFIIFNPKEFTILKYNNIIKNSIIFIIKAEPMEFIIITKIQQFVFIMHQ